MRRVRTLGLLILAASLSAACGSKLGGSCAGQAQLHIKSYDTGSYAASGESAEKVVATRSSKSASEYYLSFDETGPLRCKLLIANKNLKTTTRARTKS